ncbi:MAG: FG-GAP repeat domain-containing protein [Candidatus Glassbacteria bacterium]
MNLISKSLFAFFTIAIFQTKAFPAEPFFARYDLPALGSSYDITKEDFDEDGFLDLALTCEVMDAYYISFFWGDGTGLFPTRYDRFHNGQRPNSIQTGDFNQDNDADIVVVNTLEHTVGTYLGDGSGSFSIYYTSASDDYPTYCIVDRLDGDSYDDLIAVSWVYGKAYVFLGQGDGFFQLVESYDVGGGASMVATADFFEDGNADFVVSNMAYNEVVIMFGTGSGTFYGTKSIDVGYDAFAVATPDLNGDDHNDIVCLTKHTFETFLGDGEGGFAALENFYYLSPGARDIEPLDVDGDGNVDIACSFTINDMVRVYRGDGSGAFPNKRSINSITRPYGITSGDFNGDGHTDLAVSSSNSENLTILLNQWGVASLDLLPPPETDVERGSSISFSLNAINTQDTTITCDIWLVARRGPSAEIKIPSRIIDGPDNPTTLILDPGQQTQLQYTISIPKYIAPGYYRLLARSGYFSCDLMNEDYFEGNILSDY